MSNNDAMLLSASIIATWASVDYSVENRVLKVKKSRNLDFGQKVKNDFDLHICCHGNDLSNITNWQHIGGGPSDRNFCRNFCPPRHGIFNFHLWRRFFSRFDKINTCRQQKQLLLFLSNMTPKVLPTYCSRMQKGAIIALFCRNSQNFERNERGEFRSYQGARGTEFV